MMYKKFVTTDCFACNETKRMKEHNAFSSARFLNL